MNFLKKPKPKQSATLEQDVKALFFEVSYKFDVEKATILKEAMKKSYPGLIQIEQARITSARRLSWKGMGAIASSLLTVAAVAAVAAVLFSIFLGGCAAVEASVEDDLKNFEAQLTDEQKSMWQKLSESDKQITMERQQPQQAAAYGYQAAPQPAKF